MTRNEFVEAAILGGWKPINNSIDMKVNKDTGSVHVIYDIWKSPTVLRFKEVVADPKAWKAVGGVKKWEESPRMMALVIPDQSIQKAKHEDFHRILTRETSHVPWWLLNMHRCFDAVASGATFSEFIEKL